MYPQINAVIFEYNLQLTWFKSTMIEIFIQSTIRWLTSSFFLLNCSFIHFDGLSFVFIFNRQITLASLELSNDKLFVHDCKMSEFQSSLTKRETVVIPGVKKLNFDDVTVEHDCILPGKFYLPQEIRNLIQTPLDAPDIIKTRLKKYNKILQKMLSWIVVSKFNPNTKKYFQSSESIRNEVTRHISSDYWFIIHPFSIFR